VKLLRLPRAKVELGVALPWNVRDEHGRLLLAKGHIVANEQQLDALLQRGVFVDEEEARAAAKDAADKLLISGGDPSKSVTRATSLFDQWDQTTDDLIALVEGLATEPGFPDRVQDFVRHILGIFDTNPDIAIYRTVRQENIQSAYYGYAHAVHAATLCILIARHLRWAPDALMSLVSAALTMNMPILVLQGQMAGQDHPLRDKQRAAIRAHPGACVEQLVAAGVADAAWLDAVANHHERADGSGYPNGVTTLSEMAIALRVADVFTAKISPRVLRAAMQPKEAVAQLYREDQGGALSTAVIKEFGIYPPGDFVRLANGELAVVVQRTANARAPVVAAITDTGGRSVAKTTRRDTGQAEFAIVEAVADKSLLKRLAPERLYGYSTAAPAA